MANVPMKLFEKRFESPFREVTRLQNRVDRLFDDLLFGYGGPTGDITTSEYDWLPVCDVKETDKEYKVSFDLPGIPKDEVKIELSDQHLVISGERKKEREEKHKGFELSERYYGKFHRVLALPMDVKAEEVKASYKDGVLEIMIPKAATSKSRVIQIEEKKAA